MSKDTAGVCGGPRLRRHRRASRVGPFQVKVTLSILTGETTGRNGDKSGQPGKTATIPWFSR